MQGTAHRRSLTRPALAVVAAVGMWLLLPATAAWAPHVPQLNVSPAQVRPGGEVAVIGTRGYGFTNPVEIHFNAVDGPLLGTFKPDNQVYAAWGPGNVTIPADTKPGTYTLFATQVLAPTETHIRGIPARASLDVIGPGGPPVVAAPALVPGDPGAADLAHKSRTGTGTFVLIGLGVAGTAMLLAGLASVAAARRRQGAPDAQAAP
jgi:hypothetical protein